MVQPNSEGFPLFQRLVVLTLLGGLVAFLACGEKQAPPPGVEQRAITIGVQDNAFSGLVLIAERLGAFREEGLQVSLRKYQSGKHALQGMFAGEVDVAAVAEIPVAIAAFERDDFCVFSSIATTDKPGWILARTDAGISTPKDLRGKRIGTQGGSGVHFFLSLFLLEQGIPENEVRIVFLPVAELAGALAAGKVDAIAMLNPIVAAARASLPGKTVEFFSPGAFRQHFNLAARRDLLERAPGTAAALLRALVKAEKSALDDPERGRRLVNESLGDDHTDEVRADWGDIAFKVSLTQELLMNLEEQGEWTARRGLATGLKPENYLHWLCIEPLRSTFADRLTVYD